VNYDKLVFLNNGPKDLRHGGDFEFIVFLALNKTKESNDDSIILIMKNIAEKHPFVEGNKRTAYVIGKTLLIQKGKLLCVQEDRAIKYMKILAIKKEKDEPFSLINVKKWILLSCEEVSPRVIDYLKNNNELVERYIINKSKMEQRKIKKYIKDFPLFSVKKRGKRR